MTLNDLARSLEKRGKTLRVLSRPLARLVFSTDPKRQWRREWELYWTRLTYKAWLWDARLRWHAVSWDPAYCDETRLRARVLVAAINRKLFPRAAGV